MQVTGEITATGGAFTGEMAVGSKLTMGEGGEITNASEDFRVTAGGVRFKLQESFSGNRAIIWGTGLNPSISGFLQSGTSVIQAVADVVDLTPNGPSVGGYIHVGGAMTIAQLNTIASTDDSLWNDEGALKWEAATIWTSANDGTGSGLDADTLDGSHASSFAASSHTHSTSDITSGTFNAARLPSNTVISSGTPSDFDILIRTSGQWASSGVQTAMTAALGGPIPWVESNFLKLPANAITNSPPVSQTNSFIPVDINGTIGYLRIYQTGS